MKEKQGNAQEFIGSLITITASTSPHLIGLCGEIVDETKNTFVIMVGNQKKRIIKSTIAFRMDNQSKEINGKDIAKRPEDRIKMRIQNE